MINKSVEIGTFYQFLKENNDSVILFDVKKEYSNQITEIASKKTDYVFSKKLEELKDKTVFELFDSDKDKMKNCLMITGMGQYNYFYSNVNTLSDSEKLRLFISYSIYKSERTVLIDGFEFENSINDDEKIGFFLNIYRAAKKNGQQLIILLENEKYKNFIFSDIIINSDDNNNFFAEFNDIDKMIHDRIMSHILLREGTLDDYTLLSRYHYIPVPDTKIDKVFCVCFNSSVVGANLVASPINEIGLENISKNRIFEFIKDHIATSKRIVISPFFRGLGLGMMLRKYSVDNVSADILESRSSMLKNTSVFENWGGHEVDREYRKYTPKYDALSEFLVQINIDIDDDDLTKKIDDLCIEERNKLNQLVLDRLCELDGYQWMYYEQLVKMIGNFSEEEYNNAKNDYIKIYQKQYADTSLDKLVPLCKKWDSAAYVFKGYKL